MTEADEKCLLSLTESAAPDAVIGMTRIVSNAKGYGPWLPRERTWDNPDFDEKLIVEI